MDVRQWWPEIVGGLIGVPLGLGLCWYLTGGPMIAVLAILAFFVARLVFHLEVGKSILLALAITALNLGIVLAR
jgi:hypothetical protein